MKYNLKFDDDGFVIDATANDAPADYVLCVIKEHRVLPEFMNGFYKFVDGHFIKDEAKYAEYLASLPVEE